MDSKNLIIKMSEEYQVAEAIELNQKTERFGLSLSQKEAKLLVQEKNESLKEKQRVEFREGILPKVIMTFCDSPYIYQDNYVESIGRLVDIFYLYKNESLDELSDDELLEFMKKEFDGTCEGSLDYLEDTSLEAFARAIRRGDVNEL